MAHGGRGRSHCHASLRHQPTFAAEISLFPMNQRAEDLLMGAPSEVTPRKQFAASFTSGLNLRTIA